MTYKTLLFSSLLLLQYANSVQSEIWTAGHNHSTLRPRADEDSYTHCFEPCQLSQTGRVRRSNCFGGRRACSDTTGSAVQSPEPRSSLAGTIAKRVWKIVQGQSLVQKAYDYTNLEIANYLWDQFHTQIDNQYQNQIGLVYSGPNGGGDERAVSVYRPFGDQAFQLGTNGIYGCQVVTVVSSEAVWMAHFWETYTHGYPASDTVEPSDSLTAFDERMIYFLTGRTNPASPSSGTFVHDPDTGNGWPRPYIPPVGPALNKAMFPAAAAKDGDGIQVAIATPRDFWPLGAPDPGYRYKKRVDRVKNALVAYLGSKIKVAVFSYTRLDKNRAEQETRDSVRGQYLFQFDPHADPDTDMGDSGQGTTKQRQWRLFNEGVFDMGYAE